MGGANHSYLRMDYQDAIVKGLSKILVPTDLSESSLAGIGPACMLAAAFRAEIILVHVVDAPSRFRFHRTEQGGDGARMDEPERSEKTLKELAAERIQPACPVRTMVRHGDAAREIIALANEEKVDLIILATHGRSALSHVLLGSVAESVVRASGIPVMTVKPDYVRERMLESGDVEEQLHI